MQARPLARRIRWIFVTILAVTVAAGCAQPDNSDAPIENVEDGDLDGIPDNKSSTNIGMPQDDDNETAPGEATVNTSS